MNLLRSILRIAYISLLLVGFNRLLTDNSNAVLSFATSLLLILVALIACLTKKHLFPRTLIGMIGSSAGDHNASQ